jgi:hypothetical protein
VISEGDWSLSEALGWESRKSSLTSEIG